MKKIILMLAIIGLIAGSYAQTLTPNDIPAKISTSFERSHPKISPVEWSKVGDDYKASYVVEDKNMAVVYNVSGKLIETEKEISISQLPTPVLKYVNDNFPGEVVKKKVLITSAKGKSSYELQINQQDLAFNSQGKLLPPETK
ncbi:MAG: PepSY-like domain-containing protein [Lentimicrobiaceae bacterium]|jgi:hypothetical protein